jgi:hypothetical protein
MEHRWNTRVEITAPAVIHHPREGSCIGIVRDASPGGVFIDLVNGACPLNSPVTLVLPIDRTDMLEVPAMVVRVDPFGVGVMFLEHDDDVALALRRWVDRSRRALVDAQAMDSNRFPLATVATAYSMDTQSTKFR